MGTWQVLTISQEPALPTIVAQFHALHDMGAYGSAYLLPQCVLHPTCNKLYSMYSFASVYISSILIFFCRFLILPVNKNSADEGRWMSCFCPCSELTTTHMWPHNIWNWGCWPQPRRIPPVGIATRVEETELVNGRFLLNFR